VEGGPIWGRGPGGQEWAAYRCACAGESSARGGGGSGVERRGWWGSRVVGRSAGRETGQAGAGRGRGGVEGVGAGVVGRGDRRAWWDGGRHCKPGLFRARYKVRLVPTFEFLSLRPLAVLTIRRLKCHEIKCSVCLECQYGHRRCQNSPARSNHSSSACLGGSSRALGCRGSRRRAHSESSRLYHRGGSRRRREGRSVRGRGRVNDRVDICANHSSVQWSPGSNERLTKVCSAVVRDGESVRGRGESSHEVLHRTNLECVRLAIVLSRASIQRDSEQAVILHRLVRIGCRRLEDVHTETVSPKTYTADPENVRDTVAPSWSVYVDVFPENLVSLFDVQVPAYVNLLRLLSSTVVLVKVAL
jgi:hypothetical protein